MGFSSQKAIKKPATFIVNKSKSLAMDTLHLHEKFTKENFLNLCSLRWSEWGRWRRFFVISGAIAAIVVSAPSFVMILPCVTVFYLISCTVKNAVEIVSNWKWGPIFPKKRIKKDEILNEVEEDRVERGLEDSEESQKTDDLEEKELEDDSFLDSLESIDGEEEEDILEEDELDEEEVTEEEEYEDNEEGVELPDETGEEESLTDGIDLDQIEQEELLQEDVLVDEENYKDVNNSREESSK